MKETVLLQTTVSPTSIKIPKTIYAEIFPDRVPRNHHVVFSPKTKRVYVEIPLGQYLVSMYSQVSYAVEPDFLSHEETAPKADGIKHNKDAPVHLKKKNGKTK